MARNPPCLVTSISEKICRISKQIAVSNPYLALSVPRLLATYSTYFVIRVVLERQKLRSGNPVLQFAASITLRQRACLGVCSDNAVLDKRLSWKQRLNHL
jgi:hypothetical protein